MRVLLRTLGVVACAALLAACVMSRNHPLPGGSPFEYEEFRFVAPTGWEVRPSRESPHDRGRIVVYLASQPLRDDCVEVDAELSCRSPLVEELRAGGMFVIWTAGPCVAAGCDLPATTLIPIGNRQGVQVPMTAGCDETRFTERFAYYVTVTPQRVDILFVCARDPSDATRSAFLGFLDAIRWRIP